MEQTEQFERESVEHGRAKAFLRRPKPAESYLLNTSPLIGPIRHCISPNMIANSHMPKKHRDFVRQHVLT